MSSLLRWVLFVLYLVFALPSILAVVVSALHDIPDGKWTSAVLRHGVTFAMIGSIITLGVLIWL